MVEVSAGETLVTTAGLQDLPGFLCAADLDPGQVWKKKRQRIRIRIVKMTKNKTNKQVNVIVSLIIYSMTCGVYAEERSTTSGPQPIVGPL